MVPTLMKVTGSIRSRTVQALALTALILLAVACGGNQPGPVGTTSERETEGQADTSAEARIEKLPKPCGLTAEQLGAILGHPGKLMGTHGEGGNDPCLYEVDAGEAAFYNVRFDVYSTSADRFQELRKGLEADFQAAQDVDLGDDAFYIEAQRFAQLSVLDKGVQVTVSYNDLAEERPADTRAKTENIAKALLDLMS